MPLGSHRPSFALRRIVFGLVVAALALVPIGVSVSALRVAASEQAAQLGPAPIVSGSSTTVNMEPRAGALAVDTSNRQAVVDLYNNTYLPARTVPASWTGSIAGCIPGIHEVLRRQGLLAGRWCLDPHEDLSVGQMEQIDRVLARYPAAPTRADGVAPEGVT